MSSNNYIMIREHRGYSVSVCDMDTEEQMGAEKTFPTLRKAILYAQEIMDTEEVEYGIYFDLEG